MRCLILIAVASLLGLAPSAAQAQVYGDPNSLVDFWYRTYLGRAPDPAAAGFANALNQGVPADQVLSDILASDEFYVRAGSTPEGFVNLLFTDLVGRAPTPGEFAFWRGQLYSFDRKHFADKMLTTYPGTWVGTNAAPTPPAPTPPPVVTPPAVVTPGVQGQWYRHWERDRHPDWNSRHGIYDYRRPHIEVRR